MVQVTVRARLAFQPPWSATSINGGPEKFRARLMFDPKADWGKESIKTIRDARLKAATEKWKTKAKAEAVLEMIEGDRNKESWFEKTYRSQDGEVVEGFEGMYHLSTLADSMPLIIDRDRTELSKRDGRPYAGCYVIAKVDIWAQKNEHGNGMRATIMGLQFWKDGEPFSGGARATVEDFEDLSDLGDDDAPPPRSRRSRDEEDEDEAPRARSRSRRAPVEDDDEDIG